MPDRAVRPNRARVDEPRRGAATPGNQTTPMPDNADGQEIDNARLARGLAAWGRGRTDDPGQRRLQDEFYDTVGPRVEQVVHARIFGQPELRAAAIQEALIAIHRSAKSYDPARAGVLAWVSAIAKFCAFDQLRKRRPDDDAAGGGDPHPDHDGPDRPGDAPRAAASDGPEGRAAATQFVQALRDCVERLPDSGAIPYRQAFLLGVDSEQTIREIAAELGALDRAWLGATEEQARKWISRGIQKVRLCLESKGIRPGSLGDHHHG